MAKKKYTYRSVPVSGIFIDRKIKDQFTDICREQGYKIRYLTESILKKYCENYLTNKAK